MRTGQVHPTARSLGSHRALPVQLNSGLQLLSTVSGTKMALFSTPSLLRTLAATAAARSFTRRKSGLCHATTSPLAEKPAAAATPPQPNASRPGSPHSKKLRLTPCAAGTTKFRPSTPKYRLWNQNGTPLLSVLLWQAGGNRQSAASQPAEKLVANPNASRPGSPHSKKLRLTSCAAGTTKFRTSTPQYRL
jgi:hypothetical protein